MTEQNTPQAENTTVPKVKKPKVNRGPFATLEEVQQHRPEGGGVRAFRVAAPDGTDSWVWHDGPNSAIVVAAKTAGWAGAEHGKAPTKEKGGSLLAQLTAEDRAILIAQFVPAPDKAPAKGKK